jgi:hypothetical protein
LLLTNKTDEAYFEIRPLSSYFIGRLCIVRDAQPGKLVFKLPSFHTRVSAEPLELKDLEEEELHMRKYFMTRLLQSFLSLIPIVAMFCRVLGCARKYVCCVTKSFEPARARL